MTGQDIKTMTARKEVRTGQQNRIPRTGSPEQDSQKRSAKKSQPKKDTENGLPGRNCQKSTARTGFLVWITRTEQPGQDCQDRTTKHSNHDGKGTQDKETRIGAKQDMLVTIGQSGQDS